MSVKSLQAEIQPSEPDEAVGRPTAAQNERAQLEVALLTGGDDKPYVLGLCSALIGRCLNIDVIGSDAIDSPELHVSPAIRFLNLRGDQTENVSLKTKVVRICRYYFRLVWYACSSNASVFHILWNNKFEFFDRTVLMLLYRLLGKKVTLTAHNINAAKRDKRDNVLNRISLRLQYRLSHQIFVHSQKAKSELMRDFSTRSSRITVIPFGINSTLPTTGISRNEARQKIGVLPDERTLLFFGQIAPYKGLEYLVEAVWNLRKNGAEYRLIIAGRVKSGNEEYWSRIRKSVSDFNLNSEVIVQIKHIPDEEVEALFMAADVVVLPYVSIFQSGVPFLAYNFGLPVIATDVGSLGEDVIKGQTGLVCKPCDAAELAKTIDAYFSSELYYELDERRSKIRSLALERHSWQKVGDITEMLYRSLVRYQKALPITGD